LYFVCSTFVLELRTAAGEAASAAAKNFSPLQAHNRGVQTGGMCADSGERIDVLFILEEFT
jgi:hypothetical protein